MSILPASSIGDESTGFYNGVATQSLRLDGNSALTITHDTAPTLNTKGTVSTWIKLHDNNDRGYLIQTGGTSNNNTMDIRFGGSQTNDGMHIGQYGKTPYSNSTSIRQRDFSAWYHLLVSFDSTSSTASERLMKIFINGTQITDGTFGAISQNEHFALTIQNQAIYIGRHTPAYNYFISANLADFHIIDGQALTPSSFTEIKNGICIPKAYDGTYGNNGFRLEFKETGTSQNASGIGADTSGNDNHFAIYSSTVEAHDSNMLDSPENNFCTLNPLIASGQKSSATYSEGNLKYTSTDAYDTAIGTIGVSSGKWYYETRLDSAGFQLVGARASPYEQNSSFLGQNTSNSGIGVYRPNGQVYNETSGGTSAFTISSGDIIQVAFDADNGYFWFGQNNTYTGTVDSATGRFTLASWSSGEFIFPAQGYRDSRVVNFGQDGSFAGALTGGDIGTATDDNGNGAFKYAPPSGYLALCSANLPDVTIGPDSETQADDHFNTVLYTGDGQTTNDITGVGFKPDFTWLKERDDDGSHIASHVLADSSRGYEFFMVSNAHNADSTGVLNNNASRSNDGFQTTNSGASNQSGQPYVSWNWLANGGTTVSNTEGTRTSTVQANTDAGFSIVKYTGNGTNPSGGTITFGHGLNSTPELIIHKNRDSTTAGNNYWTVWTPFHTGTNMSFLSFATNNTGGWNASPISDTVFSPPISNYGNVNNEDYIVYLWHSVEGYSKIGTYSGNSSTDGAYVYTGFRPAWILIKNISANGQWFMLDNKRIGYNGANYRLLADASSEEYTGASSNILDILSNGFKLRQNSQNYNQSYTYIYLAFAEHPFKFSNAR